MKRRIFTLCVFLLLGAIINVIVAWGIWSLPWPSGGSQRVLAPPTHEVQWWLANRPDGFEDAPSGYVDDRRFGRSIDSLDYDSPSGAPRVRNSCMRIRAGWPFRAFEGAVWSDPWRNKFRRRSLYYPPEGWPCSKTGIPYRALWSGMGLNTVTFALACWTLLIAGRALRRRRRIKRGLCPACAYPVGTNAVCTECGKVVRR